MARDIASTSAGTRSDSRSLTSEMFAASLYKPNQGQIVRRLTTLGIAVVVTLACWSLYVTLRGSMQPGAPAMLAIPCVAWLVGLWFSFRVTNWPRFADFLIAVEAEMNKVTWPSKDELKRASYVVIFTIAFLAISLFLFDVFWQFVFGLIGVTT